MILQWKLNKHIFYRSNKKCDWLRYFVLELFRKKLELLYSNMRIDTSCYCPLFSHIFLLKKERNWKVMDKNTVPKWIFLQFKHRVKERSNILDSIFCAFYIHTSCNDEIFIFLSITMVSYFLLSSLHYLFLDVTAWLFFHDSEFLWETGFSHRILLSMLQNGVENDIQIVLGKRSN